MELLLELGADPNTGMAAAAAFGNIYNMRLLLWRGADPTPGIRVAAAAGHTHLVKLLQERAKQYAAQEKVAG